MFDRRSSSVFDTSKFIEGTVDSGKINDTLYGINAGINCLVVFVNPKIFDKAGVAVPDDTTWTWDSLIDTAAEVPQHGRDGKGHQDRAGRAGRRAGHDGLERPDHGGAGVHPRA